MKLFNLLLYHLKQFGLTAEEFQEMRNEKDKKTRLKELRGYHTLLGQVLEKMEDESFRKDPVFAAKRAVLRNNGNTKLSS